MLFRSTSVRAREREPVRPTSHVVYPSPSRHTLPTGTPKACSLELPPGQVKSSRQTYCLGPADSSSHQEGHARGTGAGPLKCARAVRIPLAGAKRRAGAQVPASEEWWQGNPLKWEPGRLDREDIPGRRRKRNSLAGDAGLEECGAWWRAICLCVRPGRVLEVGGGGPGGQRELKRARRRIITLPSCWPS